MHYKRWSRRARHNAQEKPGPKPRYDEATRQKYGGAPTMSVRVSPELWAWIQEHGGGGWVRGLLVRLRVLSQTERFAELWRALDEEEVPSDGER